MRKVHGGKECVLTREGLMDMRVSHGEKLVVSSQQRSWNLNESGKDRSELLLGLDVLQIGTFETIDELRKPPRVEVKRYQRKTLHPRECSVVNQH